MGMFDDLKPTKQRMFDDLKPTKQRMFDDLKPTKQRMFDDLKPTKQNPNDPRNGLSKAQIAEAEANKKAYHKPDDALATVLPFSYSDAVSFGKGFTHNIDEYGASINKGLGKLSKAILPKKYQTSFFDDNAKYWNVQRKQNEIETEDNKVAHVAGEMILDPVNLTPAGVINKGRKLTRVGKSVVAGAGVGYATSKAKNYGNDDLTDTQKSQEDAVSTGFVSLLNGVIAGLTDGKVTNAIKDVEHLVGDGKEVAQRAIDTLINDPERVGFSRVEAEALKEQYNTIINSKTPQPELIREKSNATVPTEDIFSHPRAKEAIDLARDRYASQTYNDRVGGGSASWMNPDGTYARAGANGETNYHQGFNLTKADVKKIDKGNITPEIEAKLRDDIDRLENDPNWNTQEAPIQETHIDENGDLIDSETGQALFSNAGHNLAGGFGAGTVNAGSGLFDGSYDPNKDLTDQMADKFIQGMVAGTLGVSGLRALRKANPKAFEKVRSWVMDNDIKVGDKMPTDGVQLGVFAGKKAKGFEGRTTHVGKYDGQERFEINDSVAEVNPNAVVELSQKGHTTLGKLMKHDELFSNYPQLENVVVKFDKNMDAHATFDGENVITLSNKFKNKDELASSILHEVQHWVQNKEGFAGGGNFDAMLRQVDGKIYDLEKRGELSKLDAMNYRNDLDYLKNNRSAEAYNNYKKIAGEIEAREVQARHGLSAEERGLIEPYNNSETLGAEEHSDEAYNSAFMAELDGRLKDFDTTGIDPKDATLDFSRSKSDHAKALEKDFIHDGKVDTVRVAKYAEPLPLPVNNASEIEKYLNGGMLDTPIGAIAINPKGSFNHFVANTHNQNRIWYSGGFIPTLKNPLFVVSDTYKGKDTAVFYKPFKDKNNNIVHLAGYAIDKNGRLVNTTLFDISPKKLKRYLEVDDDKLLFYKHPLEDGSPHSSHSNRVDNTGAYDGIIPQNSKIPNMRDGFIKLSENSNKNLDHLEKILNKDDVKEWTDLSQGLKSSFKASFLDSFSGGYHKLRANATAGKHKVAIQAQRMGRILSKLPEQMRKDIQEYIVGDVHPSSVSKEVRQIGDNIRQTIKDLQDEMRKLNVFDDEQIDAWGDRYLKRLYEKHFGDDEKNLIHSVTGGNFGMPIMKRRGHTETISQAEYDRRVADGELDESLIGKDKKDGGIQKSVLAGKVTLERDWTKAERIEMGEIVDASITVPETFMKMAQMVEHGKLLQEVAKLEGAIVPKAEAKLATKEALNQQGFVQLEKNPRFGALSGQWVRKDVADDIGALADSIMQREGDVTAEAKALWMKYLSTVKKALTVWNIPTHINNALANPFLMHGSGMSTLDVVGGVSKSLIKMSKAPRLTELLDKEAIGALSNVEKSELSSLKNEMKYYLEAEEQGLLNTSRLEDIRVGESETHTTYKSFLKKVDEKLTSAYQGGDSVSKLAMYTHLREHGWSVEKSREGALAIMPDYSKPMAPAWRTLRDSGITPFISWTYYTLPKMLRIGGSIKGSARITGAIASLYAISYALTGIGNPYSDELPDDAKMARIPVWKDGNEITTVKMDKINPFMQLMHPLQMGRETAMNGLPQTLLGLLSGTKLYNGRPVTYDNKPKSQQLYDKAKYASGLTPLPGQVRSGIDLIESLVRDEKNRKISRDIVPRSTLQNLFKQFGVNSLTFDSKQVKKARKKKESKERWF